MKQNINILFLLIILFTGCNKESEFEIFKPKFEVFVLLPTEGLGDRSFLDIIYEGTETAMLDFNGKINYFIPNSQEEGDEWINNIPGLQADNNLPSLIIIAGTQFKSSINKLEGNFGPHKLLFFGGAPTEKEGLASVVYRTYAASFIGGYLSAQIKPNSTAVIIAGFDAPFLQEYIKGFKDGVVEAGGTNSNTKFLSTDFTGFEMPDSAYQITKTLLATNDVVFALSTGSNSGIINAARNYTEQRYVVGVDTDQSWMGLNVVTGSVVKLFGADIYEYIELFSKGNFNDGHFIRSMEDGKTEFLMNDIVMGGMKIPQELIKIAVDKENQMIQP